MPKKIILKNQKNSFTRKIIKFEKLWKWPKKGQKWPFFGPWTAEFWPFFHNFLQITFKYAFLPYVQTAYLWLNPWVGIGQRASVDMHPVDCTVWGFLKNLRLPIPGRLGYFYVSIAASRAPTATMGSPWDQPKDHRDISWDHTQFSHTTNPLRSIMINLEINLGITARSTMRLTVRSRNKIDINRK